MAEAVRLAARRDRQLCRSYPGGCPLYLQRNHRPNSPSNHPLGEIRLLRPINLPVSLANVAREDSQPDHPYPDLS